MSENQISGRHIKSTFNTKVNAVEEKIAYLRERIAPLERTLPQSYQADYSDLLKQHEKERQNTQHRLDGERSKLIKEKTDPLIETAIDNVNQSRMPAPDPKIIKGNAHIAAEGVITLQERNALSRVEARFLEQRYDLLKRAHAKATETDRPNTEHASVKESFNTAAKPKDIQR